MVNDNKENKKYQHHQPSYPRAFSIKEAAEYACVSRGTMEHWLCKRLIPFEDLPCTGNKHRLRRIRKKDIDEFLDRNRVHALESRMTPVVSEKDDTFLAPKRA